jgi:hypothetical protein
MLSTYICILRETSELLLLHLLALAGRIVTLQQSITLATGETGTDLVMMAIQHMMLLRDRSIGSDVACNDLSSFERAHLNWFSFPARERSLCPKRIGNCVRPLSLWTQSMRNKACASPPLLPICSLCV